MKIRQITRLTTIAALAAIAFPSCKTTEENYRNAYEVAKAKQTEGLTADEIAGLQREEAMPRTVYNGDSIPLKGMYVKHIEGGVDNKALRYNVIVASFRQQFNARSLMTRLRDNGYPDAVLRTLLYRHPDHRIARQCSIRPPLPIRILAGSTAHPLSLHPAKALT